MRILTAHVVANSIKSLCDGWLYYLSRRVAIEPAPRLGFAGVARKAGLTPSETNWDDPQCTPTQAELAEGASKRSLRTTRLK